ncbi:MAG: hypothetical protein V1797_10490, partial [Pseudomonadota bacterium]
NIDEEQPGRSDLADWGAMFPALIAMHDGLAAKATSPVGLDWPAILAGVSDPAERDHLEALAELTREHPVRLRLVNGLVELEAPLAWRVGHAEVYAGACLRLWQYGAEAVRKHLLPRLAGR